MSYVAAALWGFGLPPLVSLGMRTALRAPVRTPRFFLTWATSAAGGVIGAVLGGNWFQAGCAAGSGVIALILWWLSRRKRKRTLAMLGNKARARLAAMIRNMPKPGPTLRPVPQPG